MCPGVINHSRLEANVKRIVSLLVVLAMVAGCVMGIKAAPATAATSTNLVLTVGKVDYKLNGVTKKSDQAPEIKNSRTFVPIRLIGEAFGADVSYDASTKKVDVLLGATAIEFVIGKSAATINGDAKLMDAAAYVSKTGRTLVPLRFIVEKSGLNVVWNAKARSITVTSKPVTTSTLKIGLVTDVGGRGDQSFNDSALRGLEIWAAQKAYTKGGGYTEMSAAAYKQSLDDNAPDLADRGIASFKNVVPVVLESKAQEDYVPNLTKLAEDEKCSLIIGVGYMLSDAVYQTAKTHPNTKFMLIDAQPTDANGKVLPTLPNLVCFVFQEQQCGYLVGTIAGMATKNNKIGYIGGMPVPAVTRYEAGFLAGVKTTNTTAYGTNGKNISDVYAGVFTDQSKGKQIAQTMISQKCDVLFHAAGATGNGMFEAIKEARAAGNTHLWGIGCDVDMGKNPNLYPAGTLTCAIKHVDYATYISIKAVLTGTFNPGCITLALNNGGVGWARDNVAKVLTAAQIKRVEKIEQGMLAGKIVPPTDPKAVASWKVPAGY